MKINKFHSTNDIDYIQPCKNDISMECRFGSFPSNPAMLKSERNHWKARL